MKISQPKNKKSLIIFISLGVILLVAAAAFLYVYQFNGNLFGWTTQTPRTTQAGQVESTDEQIKAGDATPENGSDKPPAPVTQPGNDKATVDVSITAANQNNGILQIRALIATVVATGDCTLTFTKSGQTVTKKASVQPLSSTSTCKGFDIPVSELSSGSWQLNLTYENDSLKGAVSRVVTVE